MFPKSAAWPLSSFSTSHLITSAISPNYFSVIEALNGLEALEQYRKNSADITMVLTDIGMPLMDGYELFRELKNITQNFQS